ncbi:hypothetical protein IZY60_15130 [Lutibacter sp. B2]|nr:hypothetical protein [Lutibacter sp. B2]
MKSYYFYDIVNPVDIMKELVILFVTLVVTKYFQSIIDNMDKFLEDMGVKQKYQKEAVKSAFYYLLTLWFSIYTVGHIHKIQAFIYKIVNYFSKGENIYLVKLDTLFDLAIVFLMSSIFYLFYQVGNKELRYRIANIDRGYHKTIQVLVMSVLSIGIILNLLILIQNTTLEDLYFKYINLGVLGLGVILGSLFYAGFYYKIHNN